MEILIVVLVVGLLVVSLLVYTLKKIGRAHV